MHPVFLLGLMKSLYLSVSHLENLDIPSYEKRFSYSHDTPMQEIEYGLRKNHTQTNVIETC